MKRYRVHFTDAPFVWAELEAESREQAELKVYENMIRDLLDKCPENLDELDYGDTVIEEVPPGS